MKPSELLPKALASALGQVVADFRREAKRDYDRHDAETRATISEMRAQLADAEATIKRLMQRVVREEVSQVVGSLPLPPPGRDGKDVDMEAVQDLIKAFVTDELTKVLPQMKGEPGADGKDADQSVIQSMVSEEVERAVSALPVLKGDPGEPGRPGQPGADGKDGVDGKDVDPGMIRFMVLEEVQKAVADIPVIKGDPGEPGEPGEPGRDGTGVDPEVVLDMVKSTVSEAVTEAVAAIPVIKGDAGADGRDGRDGVDGKDVDPETVMALVEDRVQRAVSALPVIKGDPGEPGRDGADGKDGVGASGAVIDRDGILCLTMTDGSVIKLGEVIGKDGKDGLNGKDGADGLNGKDGVGFDELTTSLEDEGRTIVLKYVRSGLVAREDRLSIPLPLYRGVWKSEQLYKAGDTVTHRGSVWYANKDTSERPDEGSGDWILQVKHGRDGKDGVMKKEPTKPIVRLE
jgi:hypothetical protein